MALVDLDEGPRMMSQLVGADPETLRAGLLVQVAFDDPPDGLPSGAGAPYFRVSRSASP